MLHLLLLPLLTPDAHAARGEPEPTGSTYTIIIGPSYREQGQPTLPEAATACQALAELMAQDPNTTALCGEAATRDAITGAMGETIGAMTEYDTLMFIYLGSGWTNEGYPMLLPADYYVHDLGSLSDSSLLFEREITWRLREVTGKGGKVVVLLDAIHADSIHWSEYDQDDELPRGVYTIGPWAGSFGNELDEGILAISATTGEYTVDNGLLGTMLVSALIGSADLDHDGWLTYGELESYLVLQTSESTGGQQELGSYGNWTAVRNEPLMELPDTSQPRQRGDFTMASMAKPTRYGGLGLTAVGCTTMVVARVLATSAYNDLESGNYSDRDGYNDLVGQYDRAAGFYAPGGVACATGLVLTGTSFAFGRGDEPSVTVTPTAAGLTVTW